ncbi:MAG TPA: hypothetical protein VI874_03970 [Candidatus Norongarragalinales archaeon]|nr:hypothetical protein [Candidatus Norongarragalinales archaeon]
MTPEPFPEGSFSSRHPHALLLSRLAFFMRGLPAEYRGHYYFRIVYDRFEGSSENGPRSADGCPVRLIVGANTSRTVGYDRLRTLAKEFSIRYVPPTGISGRHTLFKTYRVAEPSIRRQDSFFSFEFRPVSWREKLSSGPASPLGRQRAMRSAFNQQGEDLANHLQGLVLRALNRRVDPEINRVASVAPKAHP